LGPVPEGSRPALVTTPAGYRLDIGEDTLDSLECQRSGDLARRRRGEGQLEAAAEQYRLAIGLWRGPALADVRVGAHLEGAAVKLEEACIAALERRIDLDLRLHRHLDLIAELSALVAEHPLN